jgi:hypothetical protein
MHCKRGTAASSASGQRGLLKVQPQLSWLLLAEHKADNTAQCTTVRHALW